LSGRAVLAAWLLCAGLLAATVLALRLHEPTPPPLFHGAQIAVIGSSQTMYGIAKQGTGTTGLTGDGRSHYRIGLPAISEPESLALLARAINERTPQVLIEVWPLVYDLQALQDRGRCDQPGRTARIAAKRAQLALTDAVGRLLRTATSTQDGGDPLGPGVDLPAQAATAADGYALVPRPTCAMAQLDRLADRARAQGTQVILLAPPRSAMAEQQLGPARTARLDQAARQLATRLQVPLFAPASPWPDSRFVSLGHMGHAGRARLQADLRAWLRDQPTAGPQ